jgi:hypothetical protein
MTRRRFLLGGRVAAVIGLLAVLVVAVPTADATEGFTFRRIAGEDRYATAAAIATSSFTAAGGAIIATGETFPDALAASFLAGYVNAPILLVERTRVPQATSDALTKLGVKELVLLGGNAAISDEVARQLDESYTIVRLGGADRFITAANLALAVNPGDIGELDGKRTAFLTYGYNFPDALAIGPLANAGRFPILLNGSGGLGTPARVVLDDDQVDVGHVILVGGEAVISDVVRQQIEQMGITTSRISGPDRYATAAAIADFALARLDFIPDHLNLAKGIDPLDARQGFADALAGAVHGGRDRAPLLLTEPASLASPTRAWLEGHAATLTGGDVLGGESAVSSVVITEAERAAGSAGSTAG